MACLVSCYMFTLTFRVFLFFNKDNCKMFFFHLCPCGRERHLNFFFVLRNVGCGVQLLYTTINKKICTSAHKKKYIKMFACTDVPVVGSSWRERVFDFLFISYMAFENLQICLKIIKNCIFTPNFSIDSSQVLAVRFFRR